MKIVVDQKGARHVVVCLTRENGRSCLAFTAQKKTNLGALDEAFETIMVNERIEAEALIENNETNNE